ncbi:MAG: ABC transporter permease [Bacteroidales bacterium]|jgi:lipopolysaccharide transport system permease protein|nr:ABC transporter permease [Bacteroidales bacterium]
MNFQHEIKSKNNLFTINLKELWQYRDLISMYVKRDIVTFYKQTILGPLWFFIQPILTTIMFTFVFGNLAGISTDGLPNTLFYFAGIVIWNYFADCLTRNSKIFIENQGVFGKVYFPRLVIPISITISNLVRFLIQFLLFLAIYFYYLFFTVSEISPNIYIILVPFLILLCAGLSLGFGIIFSSLTTKYRDLSFLLQFAIQLWMYATPVIYPLNLISHEKQWIFLLNPMTSIIETFKYAFLGHGQCSLLFLVYSTIVMIFLLLFGIVVFNNIEKKFIDTV